LFPLNPSEGLSPARRHVASNVSRTPKLESENRNGQAASLPISTALMAGRFRPPQTAPTAFTPLAGQDGAVSHPYWPRMDRCIDYI
jgi:hypothetical protein